MCLPISACQDRIPHHSRPSWSLSPHLSHRAACPPGFPCWSATLGACCLGRVVGLELSLSGNQVPSSSLPGSIPLTSPCLPRCHCLSTLTTVELLKLHLRSSSLSGRTWAPSSVPQPSVHPLRADSCAPMIVTLQHSPLSQPYDIPTDSIGLNPSLYQKHPGYPTSICGACLMCQGLYSHGEEDREWFVILEPRLGDIVKHIESLGRTRSLSPLLSLTHCVLCLT